MSTTPHDPTRPAAGSRLVLLLSALLALLPAPGAFAQGAPKEGAPKDAVALTGRVTDADSKPVAGARVELFPGESYWETARRELRSGEREAVATAATDAAGLYRLTLPHTGFWELSTTAEGRVGHDREVGPVERDEVADDTVLPPAAAVTVRVLDADGAPVAGARVAVVGDGAATSSLRRGAFAGPFSRPGATPVARTRRQAAVTGDDGRAVFERRDGETLAVTAFAPGHAPGHLEEAGDATLTVRLERGAPLPVEVRDTEGAPVAGAVVAVGAPPVAAAATGEDGRLTLTRAADREMALAVYSESGAWMNHRLRPDELAAAAEARTGSDGANAATGTTGATAAEPEPLVLNLPPVVTVSGRTLDADDREPVAGARVWSAGEPRRAVRSDSRGNFTLTAASGRRGLFLRADAVGHAGTATRLRPSQVEAGEPVTLLLARTVSVSGRVVDAAGEAVPGAEVWSRTQADQLHFALIQERTFADADGRFTLPELATGSRVTVHARHAGHAPGAVDLEAVEAGGEVRDVEITLPASITAVGRVVDLDERPVAGAEVRLEPALESGDPFAMMRARHGLGADLSTRTGPDGGFELADLPEGRFDLSAEAAGFAPLTVPGVELPEAGGVVDLGTLLLEPGQRLAGRVVDPAGDGIEGATVTARDSGFLGMASWGGGDDPGVETGPDGSFTLEDLARGERLTLSARADDYTTAELEGVMVPSEDPVTLVLQPAVDLSGTVVDGDGAPVEGARVRVYPEDSGGFPFSRGATGTSDRLGRFVVEDVAPGRLTASVSASGFLAYEERGLEVAPGEDRQGLRFELQRGHTITGRVVDEAGRPLPAEMVSLVDSRQAFFAGPASSTTTDADGVYELPSVPAGEQSVAVHAEGFVRQVRDLTVVAGDNRLDFRLRRGLSVSGRVIDETGAPLEGAAVALDAAARMIYAGGGGQTRTDAAGAFRIEGVEPGSYKLRATKEGYAAKLTDEAVEVRGPVSGVEIQLDRGAVVRGRVLGAELSELAGGSVMAVRLGDQGSMPSMSSLDYEGRFRLEGVAEGEWTLMVVLGQRMPAGQQEITVEPGQRELEVDIDLDAAGATLRGRVLLAGEPLTEAFVAVTGTASAAGGFARTDHQGRFEIGGLEDGTYELQVTRWTTGRGHRESVEVVGDTEVELDIPAAGVEGVVLSADGEPVAGARVRFQRRDEAAAGFQSPVTTDRAGRFRLTRLPAGSYRLRGEADGHAPGEAEVTVEEGSPVAGVEIRLAAASGLELVVGDGYGGFPQRVDVAALDPARPVTPADDPLQGGPTAVYGDNLSPGEGGRLSLDGLPAGRWSLLVSSQGTATVRLEVSSPGPAVSVTLPPGHDLRVRVPELEETGLLGRVWLTGADGRPVVDVNFMGQLQSNWALQGGVTRLERLPAGTWTVTAATPDGRTWTGTALTGGGTAEVVLE